jgi:putative transposase
MAGCWQNQLLKRGQARIIRIKAIKIRFVRAVAPNERRSSVRAARGERGIWQRRFWEHALRDDEDYARHMDYVHYNPVKHGHVAAVARWPYSTFHRWVQAGVYPIEWGGGCVTDVEAGEHVAR